MHVRFNPKAQNDPSQTRDVGGDGGLGGGGMQIPIPTGGGGGRVGIGTILLLIVVFVVSQCTGIGPQIDTSGDQTGSRQPTGSSDASCKNGADANSSMVCAIDFFTISVQDYWKTAYPQQTGEPYQAIQTYKYSGSTQSGCGTASSQMGPFYCPNDQRVYIDKSFMEDMLEGRLGAKGGPFALGYVIAHEYGHHIEDQLGILGRMRSQTGPTSDGVRVELMADCLAGAWAKSAQQTKDAGGQPIISDLTQDDISRAIDAAKAVGDDRIQQQSSGRVNPEQWTHGSSEQRMKWFNVGLQEGTIKACNTFDTNDL